MQTIFCPKCRAPLSAFEAEPGFEVDQCPQCKGLWLDQGELARWTGSSVDLPTSERPTTLTEWKCPKCLTPTYLKHRDYHEAHPIGLETCNLCQGIFLDVRELGEARRAWKTIESEVLKAHEHDWKESEAFNRSLRIPFESPKIRRWSLPIFFAAAVFFQIFDALQFLIRHFCALTWHELGHSLTGWLSSIPNVPLALLIPGAGWTQMMSDQPSVIVFSLLASASVWGSYRLWKAGYLAWAAILGISTLLAFILTWVVNSDTRKFWIIWSGLAGEILLPTLALLMFYFPLPDRVRWDAFRFPVALFAALGWVSSGWFWIRVSQKKLDLPMGSYLDGPNSSQGDLNQLIEVWGWKASEIPSYFLQLWAVTGLTLAASYLIFFINKSKSQFHAE